jgi:hypothetical protein
MIDSVMQGYNASIFMYGATGAGKTYTYLSLKKFNKLIFFKTECSGHQKIRD